MFGVVSSFPASPSGAELQIRIAVLNRYTALGLPLKESLG